MKVPIQFIPFWKKTDWKLTNVISLLTLYPVSVLYSFCTSFCHPAEPAITSESLYSAPDCWCLSVAEISSLNFFAFTYEQKRKYFVPLFERMVCKEEWICKPQIKQLQNRTPVFCLQPVLPRGRATRGQSAHEDCCISWGRLSVVVLVLLWGC